MPPAEVADLLRPHYGQGTDAAPSTVCIGIHDGQDAAYVALAAPLSGLAYAGMLRHRTVISVKGFEVGADAHGHR